jgi:hypothetical protein
MMPDGHDARSLQGEERVAQIVARCGNIFTRFGLSPPWALRDAARHWTALSPDEVARVVAEHLDLHHGGYHGGSGDGLFHLVEAAIRKAIEQKYPRPERQREPERPQRPRNRVVQIPTASGVPDIYVEGDAARVVRDVESPVERQAVLPGYERAGEPIEDGEGGA